MKNYYTILGIKNDASQEEIKTAYRKLSVKFHPDKNDNDEFLSEMFKNINEAKETLSNFEKRQSYDVYLSNYTILHQQTAPTSEPHHSEQYPKIRDLVAVYVDKARKATFAKHQLELAEKLSKPTNFSLSKIIFILVIIAASFWYLKPDYSSASNNTNFQIVTNQKTTIYSKPDIKSKSIDVIEANTELKEVGSTTYFIKVQFTANSGNTQTGFILKNNVEKKNENSLLNIFKLD